MTRSVAEQFVNRIGGEWFHGTPQSLIELVLILDKTGMEYAAIERLIGLIIADMRNEYGD
jgi:hypothetical protein